MDERADLPELEVLDVGACLELLGECSLGRVALNERLGPIVVPVNYALDGDTIVFRTDEGAKLRGVETQPMSFQVDGFDELRETGWSVLVRGVAHEVAEGEVAHLHLRSWAAGAKRHWVRLVPSVVTGRRVAAVELPFDDRGYR